MEKRGRKPLAFRCDKCKSGFTYITKKHIVCRKCGHKSRRKDGK